MGKEIGISQKAGEYLRKAGNVNLYALLWCAPTTCQYAAWKLLIREFTNPEMVPIFRASGMLGLILNKIDRFRWQKMSPAWPHLTIGELQTVLLRAARSRKTYDWYEGDAGKITKLMLSRADCGAEDVFFVMQNVPTLREELFPELVCRGPAFIHLLHCLGMKEVWVKALDEILRRDDWSFSPQLRQSFVAFETKHLPMPKLKELLAWQYRKGILQAGELLDLADQKGYKLAARRVIKEIGIKAA